MKDKEAALERQWYCLQCQTLKAVSDFAEDVRDTSGHKRICIDCEAGRSMIPARDSKETSTLRLPCTNCKVMKPLEAFYPDKHTPATRHGRKYMCTACQLEYRKAARARRQGLSVSTPLVGTGTRIHVGNGVITQDKQAGELAKKVVQEMSVMGTEIEQITQPTVPEYLPATAVSAYADMTVAEWLAMDTNPSVFVVDHYALVLTRQGDQQHIDILSISGDGPGRPVDTALASYIVRILLHGEEGSIRGAMFY